MHSLCPCRDPSLPGVFTSIVFQYISSAAPKVILSSEDHQLLKPYILHSLKLSDPSWFDPSASPDAPSASFFSLVSPLFPEHPYSPAILIGWTLSLKVLVFSGMSHPEGSFSPSLFHLAPAYSSQDYLPPRPPCCGSPKPPPLGLTSFVGFNTCSSLSLRIKPDFIAWCLVST